MRHKTLSYRVLRGLGITLIGLLISALIIISLQRYGCIIERCKKDGNSTAYCVTFSKFYYMKYFFKSCEV